MEFIGEKLKTSREEKGLSLQEVSEDLKITEKDLRNIEQGNQKAFVDIYVLRNCIYDYAKYLGLDYEQIIDEFNEYMFEYTSRIPVEAIERISKQKEKEESNKEALSPYTSQNLENPKKKWIVIVGIVILVLAIITTVFIIKQNERKDNELVMSALM